MKTTEKNVKTTDLKNGDVQLTNQVDIDVQLKNAQAEVKRLAALKREQKQNGPWSLTTTLVCKTPSITYEKVVEELTKTGIDCVAKKDTIYGAFNSTKNVIKSLAKFGHFVQKS